MSTSWVIIINCRSQFIISRTNAFIFTSPSSDKLRNFSATLALMTRSADSRSSSRLQRRCALGYRLVTYFSRQDNRQLWSAMMFCRSTTPAASAGITTFHYQQATTCHRCSISTLCTRVHNHTTSQAHSPQVFLENHRWLFIKPRPQSGRNFNVDVCPIVCHQQMWCTYSASLEATIREWHLSPRPLGWYTCFIDSPCGQLVTASLVLPRHGTTCHCMSIQPRTLTLFAL